MGFDCFNYIKFSGEASEEGILHKYFNLVDNLFAYNPEKNGCIGGFQYNKEKREILFISSSHPPIAMYNSFAEDFPEVEIYYEYQEPDVGICGYGELNSSKIISFIQKGFRYQTKDEYEQIKKAYMWVYPIWNEEFEVGAESKIDGIGEGDLREQGETFSQA